MTGEERERARLRYIQESIARIAEYTRGGRAAFIGEPMVQDAVLRRLETLADAAQRLSDALKARHRRSAGGRSTGSGASPRTRTSSYSWIRSGRSSRSTCRS